jgi:uncharacterized membrane protein
MCLSSVGFYVCLRFVLIRICQASWQTNVHVRMDRRVDFAVGVEAGFRRSNRARRRARYDK